MQRWIVRAMAVFASVSALAAGTAGPAQSYKPSFHPDRLKGSPKRKPNEVMVLGTTHLSELPETFRVENLMPLLDRLAAWRPTAIATENMSGLQCDALRRYPSRYTSATMDYCPDPTVAGRALNLDVPAANAEAERTLRAWAATPTAAQRRRLAGVFLAAGEPGSALVQWLRLPPEDRRAGDGLTDELVAVLERQRVRRNETSLISAPLAARLSLERLWRVDDHSADMPSPPDEEKAYEAAIARAWDNPVIRQRIAWSKPLEAGIDKPGGVIALYRAYNSPKAQDLASDRISAQPSMNRPRRGTGAVMSDGGRRAICAWSATSATCSRNAPARDCSRSSAHLTRAITRPI